MKRWLIFIVLVSVLSMTPYAEAQEMKYGYDEAYDEVVYAVASEQLSEEAYALYEQLKTIMQARQATFSVTYTGAWAQSQADFKQAVAAVLREDEYLAYDYLGYRYSSKGYDSAVTFTGTASYIQNAEQVTYVTKQIKKILPTIITPQMDDYAKVKAVHDYVVTNVAYDTSMSQAVNAPYFALTGGKTLCNGYAMLVHQMLQEANIPVRLISGVAGHGSNVENHAWNLVQVGGKWFHLDATWDDPIPDVAGRVLYNYYLLSDREIGKDHIWQNGGLNNHDAPYPSANTELFMHLILTNRQDVRDDLINGLPIAEDEAALKAIAQANFAMHKKSFTILYQGATSPASIIHQATTGQEHNVMYRTVAHRMPNTTQITVTVGSYSGVAVLPSITAINWLTALPTTITEGESLPVGVVASYTDGKVVNVVDEVSWSGKGYTYQDKQLTFSSTGLVTVTATIGSQTIRHTFTIVPKKQPLAYPIQGFKALTPLINVENTKVLAINFSNPIESATDVRVVDYYGRLVPSKITVDKLRITIAPQTMYEAGATYYLLIEGVTSKQRLLPAQSMAFTIAN